MKVQEIKIFLGTQNSDLKWAASANSCNKSGLLFSTEGTVQCKHIAIIAIQIQVHSSNAMLHGGPNTEGSKVKYR
jgi:hypothetical protein